MGLSDPGASARREHARRNGDHLEHVLRERRFIGSLIPRPQDEPPLVRAWEQGASGERIVGARLDKIDGIEVLHDRRIPGTRATIDHVAVGPDGVYVIDAKLDRGTLRHRGFTGRLRGHGRPSIGGHDQGKLVAKLAGQVSAITRALCATPIPVRAALCFVDSQWPAQPTQTPFMLNGVWVGWPDALPDLVARPGLLDAEAMRTTARLLERRFPRS